MKLVVMRREPVIASVSIRVAGGPPVRCATDSRSLDHAVAEYLKQRHGLLVGERTAEVTRQQLGAADEAPAPAGTMGVRGRDTAGGFPKNVTLTSAEVRAALAPSIAALLDELAGQVAASRGDKETADVADVRVVFEGGEMLAGLAELVRSRTGLREARDDNPSR